MYILFIKLFSHHNYNPWYQKLISRHEKHLFLWICRCSTNRKTFADKIFRKHSKNHIILPNMWMKYFSQSNITTINGFIDLKNIYLDSKSIHFDGFIDIVAKSRLEDGKNAWKINIDLHSICSYYVIRPFH